MQTTRIATGIFLRMEQRSSADAYISAVTQSVFCPYSLSERTDDECKNQQKTCYEHGIFFHNRRKKKEQKKDTISSDDTNLYSRNQCVKKTD
jgi:hypothetical protein